MSKGAHYFDDGPSSCHAKLSIYKAGRSGKSCLCKSIGLWWDP